MSEQHLIKSKPSHSLGRSLLLWFLLLALAPLTLNAWLGYRQAADSLTTIAMQGLERNAQEKVRFIQNWFDYRLMDLHSQAENRRNAEFLTVLREGLQTSDLDLAEFINSNTWASLVDKRQEDLTKFMRQYDYIYDLFLIDADGNILFTVIRESDLGTNIFDGPYAHTRFARSIKVSLDTGRTKFSDLEHYIHSNNQVTGFLTTPIFDDQGNKLGLFAIQIKMKRINKLMSKRDSDSSITHYLVGDDGLLRTPLEGTEAGKTSVLVQRMSTKQLNPTHREQGKPEANEDNTTASIYRNYADKKVIGVNQTTRNELAAS